MSNKVYIVTTNIKRFFLLVDNLSLAWIVILERVEQASRIYVILFYFY